jgi:hypothetical protein
MVLYVKESINPVVVVNKAFQIPIVKSSGYNAGYIVLKHVLCPDGDIYIDGVVLLL